MPTIQRFDNWRITIHADDHMPPPFHIAGRAFRAGVKIDPLRVRAGRTRRVPEVLVWVSDNLDLLRHEWHSLNRRT
jgi:hypothetical protein